MRVIGGKAKGRHLLGPRGGALRPTADRIKQSLFDILPHDLSGMRVLELFAGTGSLSIEALSRGAASAVLVEASERSARLIRENLRRLDLAARAHVWVLPAHRALRSLAKQSDTFDLIFFDPPYEQNLVGPSLELIACSERLSRDGIVIAEHSVREPVQSSYHSLTLNDQRRYGDTLLSFFRYAATGSGYQGEIP